MIRDLRLAGSYTVLDAPDLASSSSTAPPLVYFPDGTTEGGQDGLVLRFEPAEAEPWLGMFPPGQMTPFAAILGSPDPRRVFVIVGGLGYLVDVIDRQAEMAEPVPVVDARVVLESGLVILIGYTQLTAYGANGLRWHTPQLSFDGVQLTKIKDGHVHGLGFDPRLTAPVPFVVELNTGRHSGGTAPT